MRHVKLVYPNLTIRKGNQSFIHDRIARSRLIELSGRSCGCMKVLDEVKVPTINRGRIDLEQIPNDFNVKDMLDSQLGQITLKGERFLLINADALGTLRRDLISTLGRERAKGFFLRYGWSCGYNDAFSVRQQYPDASDQFCIEEGRYLHMLEGVVRSETYNFDLNREKDSFLQEGIWLNSYEAEQHLRHFGTAKDPVCWTLIGYAGGFCSAVFGRQIVFKEVTCVGRGDGCCHWVGKTVEAWGDEITGELPFYGESKIAEELEEAHLHIQQQHQLLKQIMGMHEQLTRLVLAGKGREVIVETVGEMLGAPVLVEDRHFHPLVWWLPSESDPDLQKYLLGTYLNESSTLRSRVRRLEQDKRAIDLGPGDVDGLLPRTMAPIVLGDEVMGYVSVIHDYGSGSDELKSMITERAAAVMGLDLLKEQTALEIEHRLKGEFIDELLDETTPVESLKNRAMYMGSDLDRPHRFMLIGIDPPSFTAQMKKDQARVMSIRDALFDLVRSVVKVSAKNALVVERGEGIVVLAPTDLNPTLVSRSIKSRLRELPDKLSISICISRESTSVEQLRSTFTECRTAMQVLTRLDRFGEVFFVENLNVFDFLYAGPSQDQLRLYSERALDKIIQYEEAHAGGLLRTLYMYLAHECNLQHTARAMNLSLSGLKYRLQRLREIGELDLDNPDTRFNLQLALRILVASGVISLKDT